MDLLLMKLMMALIRQKDEKTVEDKTDKKAKLFVESMEKIARFHLVNRKIIEKAEKQQSGFCYNCKS